MNNDSISDALGIPNNVVPYETPIKVEVDATKLGVDEQDDYVLGRSTLRTVIENGATALEQLLKVATISQKARDYEVAANIMKTLADVTQTLKDIHEKSNSQVRKNNLELENLNQQPNQIINIDKAVFTGTTSQLLKEIKKSFAEDKTALTIDVESEEIKENV